jgi:hypothetical protein
MDDASNPTDAAGPTGVPGGIFSAGPTKADCKLIERALRESWPIAEATRAALVGQLAKVLKEDGLIYRKPRLYLACVKALAGLSRANLTMVDVAIRAEQHEELAARVAELEGRLPKHGNPGPY